MCYYFLLRSDNANSPKYLNHHGTVWDLPLPKDTEHLWFPQHQQHNRESLINSDHPTNTQWQEPGITSASHSLFPRRTWMFLLRWRVLLLVIIWCLSRGKQASLQLQAWRQIFRPHKPCLHPWPIKFDCCHFSSWFNFQLTQCTLFTDFKGNKAAGFPLLYLGMLSPD